MPGSDANNRLATQRDSLLTRSAGENASTQQEGQEQANLSGNPPSRTYTGISTERIMQAVEQQRRISQQLEHIQAKQQRSKQWLRITLPMLVGGVFLSLGMLIITFVVLSFFKPDLLARILALLSESIATPIALLISIEAQLPSNGWWLSVSSLVVVLMMGMWLLLMRSPQKA